MNPSSPDRRENSENARPFEGDVREIAAGDERRAEEGRTAVALCVGFDFAATLRIGSLLADGRMACEFNEGGETLLGRIVSGEADLVLVADTYDRRCLADVAGRARRLAPAVKFVVAGGAPRGTGLLDAMRAGIVDWIDLSDDAERIQARLSLALELVRDERRRDERVSRLKGICRKLSLNRDEFSERLESLTEGLGSALNEANGRAEAATLAGEFRGLISQELDVEELLRTSMQYLLTKTGATNAAVYLPGAKPTQFGLGAYVHYDCPRAQAQPLLSRLCDDVCPRVATGDDLLRFTDTSEFVGSLGLETDVLDDAELIAFSARHGEECMAVFYFFRSRAEPFAEELADLFETLRPVFAAQMAKLVRVHHRSRFQWPESRGSAADGADEVDDGGEEGWRDAA